jgi:orotate phosphoribosyltransferase
MALLDELKARDVHRPGHWELKSGRHAEVFLQCTLALQDPAFARRIGRQLADRLRRLEPDVVAAPGVSSMLLAFVVAEGLAARVIWFEEGQRGHGLRRGQRVAEGDRVVVVEDVLTTGRTAQKSADFMERKGAEVVGFAAMVDRSTDDLPLPWPATSLVEAPLVTHAPDECPLCEQGVPVSDPSA